MSLNATPSANRTRIGIFGRRNAGKSSLINALTGQDLAVVSETKGTTTDPVKKAMELLPLGPVVLVDTPGLDDEGRYRLLLENMRGQMPRTCRFVSVITCCFPNGDVLSARGECEGTVAFTPMGEGGFGYDPVFFVPPLKKTFAQLTAEEKNAISHRGKALEAFQVKLREYLEKS